MDWEDYAENLGPDFGFSGFLAIAALVATGIVQWAVKNYQAHARSYSLVPAACGLSGAEAARKMLAAIGLSDVRVTPTALCDGYHWRFREVQLTPNHFNVASLSAMAVAAHEVGHAAQFAAGWWVCRLRGVVVPLVYALMAAAAALLVLGLTVIPLTTAGTAIVAIAVVSLLLQMAVVFLLEFDATARAKTILSRSGLVTPEERPGVETLLKAAAWTYLTYEGQRWIFVFMAAVATWWLANMNR